MKTSGRGIVSCSCLLAPWTHASGRDEHPSMAVFPSQSGEAVYKCLSCQRRGLLRNLLLTLWHKGHDTFHWVEVLDGDRDATATKPLKPAERRLAEAVRAEEENFVAPVTAGESRPTYDFRLVSEADTELTELPWSAYEKHLVDLPKKYVESRGLSAETCSVWQLGNDRRRRRLMFPIRDRKGRLVAISGRLYATRCLRCDGPWASLCAECGLSDQRHGDGTHGFSPSAAKCVRCGGKKPPPYMHSSGFKRNLTLYGEQMDDPGRRLFVVEGHIDMLKLWQAGYRPVVATLGASPGATQIEKIVSRWGDRRVVVVPDGDHAGKMMGDTIARMIRGRMPSSVAKTPDGLDPGGMSEAQMRDLLGDP